MCPQRRLRKDKVSNEETIGNFMLKWPLGTQKHAYSSPSKASGKLAWARARSIRSSAS